MKLKVVFILLSVCFIFGLVGCSKNDSTAILTVDDIDAINSNWKEHKESGEPLLGTWGTPSPTESEASSNDDYIKPIEYTNKPDYETAADVLKNSMKQSNTTEKSAELEVTITPQGMQSSSSKVVVSDSGNGDDVLDLDLESDLYRFKFTCESMRHKSVKCHYDNDGYDLLVNGSGAAYNGSTFIQKLYYGDSVKPIMLEIEAKDAWSYEIETLGVTEQTSFSGIGDYVTDIFILPARKYEITFSGTRHHSVKLYSKDGKYLDLLVNESGEPYAGKVLLDKDAIGSAVFFVIEANMDDSWTISPVD